MRKIDQDKYLQWKKFVDNEFRTILKESGYSNLDLSIVLGKILFVLIIKTGVGPEKFQEIMYIDGEDKYSQTILWIINRIVKIFVDVQHLEIDCEND
jgi:hypothetical protein